MSIRTNLYSLSSRISSKSVVAYRQVLSHFATGLLNSLACSPRGFARMAKQLTIKDTVSLPGYGTTIPRLGLGVFMAKGSKCTDAILAAIKSGYRHIDSAQYYGNEAETGQAVRKSGVAREDIFVTTKQMSPSGDVESTYQTMKEGVERTGLEYVDLFLIHYPGSGPQGRRTMWAALEKLHKEGKAKAIGVSNYGVHHLKEMKEYATVYPPALNQIEQREIVDYCNQEGIPIEAYCPLVRQQKAEDPTLNAVARAYGKTPNQILVRWSLQKGWIPLPKSENPERIAQNADVYDFEISQNDMKKLDDLEEGRNGSITWTPQYEK